jgi:UDP-N-acetylglucosamine 2-epimerase (non-hydrolysing)
MRLMTIIGIRPDFIRMSEIIKGLDASKAIEHIFVHTGQHYSYTMEGVFFDEMGLRKPDINLGVGSGSHAEQTARLLLATEPVIHEVAPDMCLFLGDANASLGAIAAAKLNVKVGHIEAGMRSFDRRMPEEKNRTIVDHLSDYLFVYTHRYREHLLLEGLGNRSSFVVGNPIVDIVERYRGRAGASDILTKLGYEPRGYVLATLHREESVDDPQALKDLLNGLDAIARELGLPVYYPTSYRTAKRIKEYGLEVPSTIRQSEPLGFFDFLKCEMDAALIVTDSGTVQEEASILQVPCIVARMSTERPETVEVGGCILSGSHPEDMLDAARKMMGRPRSWKHILGDGHTSERIVSILVEHADRIASREFIPPLIDPRIREAFTPYLSAGVADRSRPI